LILPITLRTPEKRDERNFRSDIQAIGAIAAVPVVLSNFGILGIHAGFLEVDVLFAISGFVITKEL